MCQASPHSSTRSRPSTPAKRAGEGSKFRLRSNAGRSNDRATAPDPTVVRGWLINALNDRLVVCQGVPTRPHGLKVKTIGTLIAGALLDGYGALGRHRLIWRQQTARPGDSGSPDLAADAAATVFDYHRSAKAKWINAMRPVTFPTQISLSQLATLPTRTRRPVRNDNWLCGGWFRKLPRRCFIA
jgi:hypothetical protein